ncbi:MAG TPA: DUF3105 domain-containing protein [Actinomycetota bacterium]
MSKQQAPKQPKQQAAKQGKQQTAKQAAKRRPSAASRKEAERRRRQRQRIYAIVIPLVLIGVVVGGVLLIQAQSNSFPYDKVKTFGTLSRNHVTTAVHYKQTPPVGGDHNPVWQNCGYYGQPLHNENAVHSMEHGTVWITYRPDLPTDQVQRLASMAHAQTYVLVSPYPGLPAPVVASAWSTQERFRSANDPKLSEFVAKYRQGPQTPEPGAACTGGTGTPK